MAGKVSGRIKRSVFSCLILFAVAAVLAASNAFVQNRDRSLALGPESEGQKRFFVEAVDRPDISPFFKRLSPAAKLKASQNLKRYRDPRIVQLAAIWLSDFDADARKELEDVLANLGPEFPEALAKELKNTGGFQKLAVANALRKSFDKTLPAVIDQLAVGANRTNAVEYLVSAGKKAGPAILPKLDDKDKDTRIAAADALGKIGFSEAGPKISTLYRSAEPGDKSSYLASLANLGNATSEELFRNLLGDPKTSDPDRASAILGLARVASATSIAALWAEVARDPLDKRQITEALSLAGDRALDQPKVDFADLIEVAGGVQSKAADEILMLALTRPESADRAADLSRGREKVTDALKKRLIQLDANAQGRSIEKTVQALASTKAGRTVLALPDIRARFGGFIDRELSIGS